MKYSAYIIFICLYFDLSAQCVRTVKEFDSGTSNYELSQPLPINKKFTGNQVTAMIIALHYFPELDSTLIIFKEKRIRTTLNTRPSLISLLFRDQDHRKYIIRINNTNREHKIILSEVPFNALIGLYGHEFCHIMDYLNKNTFQVLRRGLCYLTKRSKEEFEKEIDISAIKCGLGWQLYDFGYFIQFESDASERYKAFKRKIYLEPEEIIGFIKSDSCYSK